MKIQNGWLHLVKTAFADFKRNKVRTALTSLGIMIGVLSVVLLIAFGLSIVTAAVLLAGAVMMIIRFVQLLLVYIF